MEKLNQFSTTQTRTTRTDVGDIQIVTNPVEFQERVSFLQLPETPLSPAVGATPSVLNNTKIVFSNSSPTDVTNLREAQEGQTVFLIGDGNTTLKNNANLVLGADLLLQNNKVTILTFRNGAWYPQQSNTPTVTLPHLTISLPCGELHTQTSNSVDEEYPNTQVWFRTVADLSQYTEFRVYSVVRNTSGNLTPKLQYSLNGSSWSAFWTGSSFTTDGQSLSSYASIPAPARAATVYFRILLNALAGQTARFTSFAIQVR